VSRHQVQHTKGHYFIMRYDAGIKTHQEVKETLKVDPRIIRATGVKLGDQKLETMTRFGAVPWRTFD